MPNKIITLDEFASDIIRILKKNAKKYGVPYPMLLRAFAYEWQTIVGGFPRDTVQEKVIQDSFRKRDNKRNKA